jgi:hypothetical protein
MEATCSSEASVDFQRTTQRYISEDKTLHNHRCENLKSYMNERSLDNKRCGIFVEGLRKTTKENSASWVHGPLKGYGTKRPCVLVLVY